MSYTREQLEIVEDAQADFDAKIAEQDWDGARAIIENLGDEGYENEAISLHKALNRAVAVSFSEQVLEMSLNKEDPRDIADRHYPHE